MRTDDYDEEERNDEQIEDPEPSPDEGGLHGEPTTEPPPPPKKP